MSPPNLQIKIPGFGCMSAYALELLSSLSMTRLALLGHWGSPGSHGCALHLEVAFVCLFVCLEFSVAFGLAFWMFVGIHLRHMYSTHYCVECWCIGTRHWWLPGYRVEKLCTVG